MRYADEERQAALDCLAANEGDYRLTSKQTGIPVATLKRWAQREAARGDELRQLRDRFTAYRSQPRPELRDDPLHQFAEELLAILMDDAIRLAEAMDDAIEGAPLNQLSAALNQVLDKILKLIDILPPVEAQVTRVEFIDCDGTSHETPYWSRRDSDE
jgi:hypothetical protein